MFPGFKDVAQRYCAKWFLRDIIIKISIEWDVKNNWIIVFNLFVRVCFLVSYLIFSRLRPGPNLFKNTTSYFGCHSVNERGKRVYGGVLCLIVEKQPNRIQVLYDIDVSPVLPLFYHFPCNYLCWLIVIALCYLFTLSFQTRA